MILGLAYKNPRGVLIPMDKIVWIDGKPFAIPEGQENNPEFNALNGLNGSNGLNAPNALNGLKEKLEPLVEFPAKMSKSLKNVINPDDVIRDYGADALRLYEMFMGPLQAVKPWSTKGVEGVARFLKRAFRMVTEQPIADRPLTAAEAKTLNATVKKVGEDLETMNFNTAISAMMVFVNEFAGKSDLPREAAEKFTLCLAPFAPHVGEELWQFLGHAETLAYEPWPSYDAAALVESEIEMPVQILGKLRGRIKVPAAADAAAMQAAAQADPGIARFLEGKQIVKVICIPKKMINFVVK
jgi:leucyl-tRNA synthetase